MDVEIQGPRSVNGEVIVNPDKSISHRAVFLSSLCRGKSTIYNINTGLDVLSSIKCMKELGVDFDFKDDALIVSGRGLRLKEPSSILSSENSGTTARLLISILSGQNFFSSVTGDDSLKRRPMRRIVEPMRSMGAKIWGRDDGNLLPVVIRGGVLTGGEFNLKVSSAQVKTALLFSNFFSKDKVKVREPTKSRDHTERMLPYFGVEVIYDKNFLWIEGEPKPSEIFVPYDFSSAAFFIVAAIICKNSRISVKNVCVNPTRTGLLDALIKMGGKINIGNERIISGEPIADIYAESSHITGSKFSGEIITRMIDEIPLLCIASAFASGETEIRDAGELRVKESDRISSVSTGLKKFGVEVEEFPDGIKVVGKGGTGTGIPSTPISEPIEIDSFSDHRIAMSFLVMGLASNSKVRIKNFEFVSTSFPAFLEKIKTLIN